MDQYIAAPRRSDPTLADEYIHVRRAQFPYIYARNYAVHVSSLLVKVPEQECWPGSETGSRLREGAEGRTTST